MLSRKTMCSWLSRDQRARVAPAEKAAFPFPVTTQVVSNGEYNPLPQTVRQSRVEARVAEFADESGCRLGLSRREFLGTASGMAAAFLAINQVYGRIFEVHKAKASGQSVFDDASLDLACFAAEHWNPLMLEEFYLEQKRFK